MDDRGQLGSLDEPAHRGLGSQVSMHTVRPKSLQIVCRIDEFNMGLACELIQCGSEVASRNIEAVRGASGRVGRNGQAAHHGSECSAKTHCRRIAA